ncbi:MAG: hypothetical protein J0I99_14890 [Devosia sp.]|uniref:hypothetical protein n=1 Tax=Devosia sp. TaxID=1871048 RepID=UPI001AC4F640|nr:hypothetical protein [Devosia sp.]MBN9317027.1 hypothetical protein [Devosia sp.]
MPFRYGPFHRVKNGKTQDYETAKKQLASGQIWGKAIKIGGAFPKVKAYKLPLCDGGSGPLPCVDKEGIEFWTDVEPTSELPNGVVYWERRDGVQGLIEIDDETIAIAVTISKVVYSERNECNAS